MEEDSLLQLKGDGGSTSIQLGVFIPKLPQTVNTGKKAKNQNTKSTSGALLEPHGDQGDGPSIKSRKREESVSYDDDDELVNGRDLPARTKRHKEVAFEEVSPTEREGAKQVVVSQKKQKRKRQHKGKKIQNAGSLEGRAKTAVEGVSALDYLHKWNSGITSWTFRKKTQYWLLKNMCDKSQVPKTEFKILLQYVEALKGNQRQLTVARAQEIINKARRDKDGGSNVDKRMYKRARAVLKFL